MAGYIGSKASVVSSGAERKKAFSITGTTTSLTGLSYTPNQVHVFHNGVRLVDGTDYTATNGTSITLTSAAENGDEVVVISYATFQPADAYTKAETDSRYVNVTGDTMTGALKVDTIQNTSGGTPTAADLGLNVSGSVLQVVSQSFNPSVISTTSTSMVNTGLSLGLTMSSASNKCFIMISGGHGYVSSGYPNGLISTICRNGGTTTYSTVNDLTGGGSFGMEQIYNSTNLNTTGHSFSFLDTSVGTTTPVYRVFFKSRSGGNVVFHENTGSFINITLMEIAG